MESRNERRVTRSTVHSESEEWICVQFTDDGIYYMCPLKNINNTKLKIGSKCMVIWKNNKKYMAKILKQGDKDCVKRFLGEKDNSNKNQIEVIDSGSNDDAKFNFNQVTTQGKSKTSSLDTQKSDNFAGSNDDAKFNFDQVITQGKSKTSSLDSQKADNIAETNDKNPFFNIIETNKTDFENLMYSDDVIDMASEVMAKILEENQNNDYTCVNSIHYPALFNKDDEIGIVADIDLFEYSFDDFYYSPGYIPDNFQIEEEAENEGSPGTRKDDNSTNITNFCVQRATKNTKHKLIKDKRIFCLYCEKLVTNFPRHLERNHIFEENVRQLILTPKKSKERKNCLELLKNIGNLQYNKDILKKKQGSIIVGRRPSVSDECNVNDFLPCTYCFKFCKKKALYRHVKICKFKEKSESCTENHSKTRNKIIFPSLMLLQNENHHKQLEIDILSRMKCDNITFVAQNDGLICSFGTRLLQNHRVQHPKKYISQRIRQLSRFLVILRTLVPELKDLKDFLKPKYFNNIVEAAKQHSGYNEKLNSYAHPSNALKIGYSITLCAELLKTQMMINSSPREDIQSVNDFLQVFQTEWKSCVLSNATQDIGKKKFNKTISLPDAKDISILHNYLSNTLSNGINRIQSNEVNKDVYKLVCQTLLTQVIVLNRHRSGEVERIQIDNYLNRNKNQIQDDIKKTLSIVENQLSKNLVRFQIRGKRGRGVPVFLTPEMKEAVDILIEKRKLFNVLEANPYMFAIPYTVEGTYRGTDCLRAAASKSGASSPELLRSTKLRKHIATMTQLLCLTENDREQLATFMGHDLAIHDEYYRLPNETLQLSRVSKILLAVDSGRFDELKGKTVEELDSFIPKLNSNIDSNDEEQPDQGNHVNELMENMDDDVSTLAKKIKKYNDQNKRKRTNYNAWTAKELEAIKKTLGKFIMLGKIPKQHDCLLAMQQEKILENRGWKKIKYRVANLIKKQFK